MFFFFRLQLLEIRQILEVPHISYSDEKTLELYVILQALSTLKNEYISNLCNDRLEARGINRRRRNTLPRIQSYAENEQLHSAVEWLTLLLLIPGGVRGKNIRAKIVCHKRGGISLSPQSFQEFQNSFLNSVTTASFHIFSISWLTYPILNSV